MIYSEFGCKARWLADFLAFKTQRQTHGHVHTHTHVHTCMHEYALKAGLIVAFKTLKVHVDSVLKPAQYIATSAEI